MQDPIQATPETRDAMEVWREFCAYCKKSRARIVLLRNVPSEEAQRALVNVSESKEQICPWVLKLGLPTHISTVPLRRPEVGLEGTPVYSYTVDFDAHSYYMAIFEKMPGQNCCDKRIVLKSLKLDERDNRNAPPSLLFFNAIKAGNFNYEHFMNEVIHFCELCDSINVSIIEEQAPVQVPLAEPVQQNLKVCKCHDCGAETVLESEPSKSVKLRAFEQGKKSIAHLFQLVNESGFSDARIERVLGLSPHTLNRWKEGKKVSASALALSRFLALFPELVSVAETGFEPNRSRHLVFNETRNWLCKNYANGGSFNISMNHSGNSFHAFGILLAENDQISNDNNLAFRLDKQQNTEQLVKV